MGVCETCGVDLLRRHQVRYCSNACQARARQQALIDRWLATGEAQVGTGADHYVRRHIAREQAHRCALCGGAAVWQGRPLVHVLDRIDGDAENNRRENLRLICPNCDAQLPTYKNRNKGRGRFSRRQRYADPLSW